MKKVLFVVALGVILLGVASTASAQEITATVRLGSISVSCEASPGGGTSWTIGTVGANSTSTQTFSCTNSGTLPAKVSITGQNATKDDGGTQVPGWTLAAAPGLDIFAVEVSDGDLGSPQALTTTALGVLNSVPASSSGDFTLSFRAPSSETLPGGEEQTLTFTYTAEQP